jgi:TRAP-type transport system periplasmic protein
LDAAFGDRILQFSFKWYEVTKCRTNFPTGIWTSPLMTSINWNVWNKLPPDVQKIFNDLSGVSMSKIAGQARDKADDKFYGLITAYDKKAGNPEIYTIPDSEYQRWVKATAPVLDKWMADMEAKGLPAKAIIEDQRSLIKKYSAK